MINLAFFLPDLGGGGAEKVFTNLINYIYNNKKNIKIILFVNSFSGPNIKNIPPNIKIIEFANKNIIFSFIKLSIELKKNNIDYLISTVRGANIAAALSTFLYKKNLWILREANTFTNPNHKQSFKDKIINLFCFTLYNRADYIIANSPDTKKDLINNCFNLKEKEITILPNPVMPLQSYSKKIIISEKNNKIISVGRLVPQKNFTQLIKAISFLVRDDKSITLDIFGEGHLKDELENLISSLNCESNIKIYPYVENITEYYSNYNLFISNSKWEGFGNVLVEAMGAGIPIVSTDCPGGPQYIFPTDSNMISLVSINSSDKELSLAIKKSLLLPYTKEDAYHLIEHAKEFSLENICQKYLNYILNLKR